MDNDNLLEILKSNGDLNDVNPPDSKFNESKTE